MENCTLCKSTHESTADMQEQAVDLKLSDVSMDSGGLRATAEGEREKKTKQNKHTPSKKKKIIKKKNNHQSCISLRFPESLNQWLEWLI